MTEPTGSPRDPITIWHRLLRGYGPFLLLAALALGMAVFVPSRVPEDEGATTVDDATSRRAGESGGDGGIVGPGGRRPPGAAGDDGTGGTGGPASRAAGVQPCTDRAEQIPGDPYSPAVLRLLGRQRRNHAPGVTGHRDPPRRSAARRTQLQRRHRRHRRRGIVDTPEEVEATLRTLVDYVNARFQLYGRKIVLDYYDGQGSVGTELVGNGRDKAEVDATKVAEEVKPFADLSALTEPYADALAGRGHELRLPDPVAGVVHEPAALLVERAARLLDPRRGGHGVHLEAAVGPDATSPAVT